MTSSSTPPVTSHPLNGGYALPKMENHPKPPPRPSISSKTASTQTSKSNHSSDALIELQVSFWKFLRNKRTIKTCKNKLNTDIILILFTDSNR